MLSGVVVVEADMRVTIKKHLDRCMDTEGYSTVAQFQSAGFDPDCGAACTEFVRFPL